MNTRILVTGGAGYIGSHTCKLLRSVGFDPVVFDNLSTGHRSSVRWGELIVGDLTNAAAIDAAVRRVQPAVVVHFAAAAYVGESVIDPAKYYRNNLVGTLNLLESCRALAGSSVVFSSSCATYGVPAILPIAENTPQRPINPYGRSKLMGEELLRDFSQAYGLRFVSLRYFNAGGADPDGELGEWHDPETHLIPSALQVAAGRRPALPVFGTDYETPDGTCVRDYIHVSDLARAHLAAVNYLLAGGQSTEINLGGGRGLSVGEVVSAITRVTGRSVPITVEPRRRGDPPTLVASTAKAADILGFRPELSDIDTLIRTAAPFFELPVAP